MAKLKEGYTQTDQPMGQFYKTEDTEWEIFPDLDMGDPGLLVPKTGAISVSYKEAHEGSHQLSEKEKAMLWERMSGERLPEIDRQYVINGGEFIPPHLRPTNK